MKNMSLCLAVLLAALPAAATAQELASDSQLPVAPALTPVKPDAEAAKATVTKALQEAEGVPAADITVSTHAGIIVLTGKVDSEAEKAAVGSIAEKTAEGGRVSNSIEVRPPEERNLKDQRTAQQSAQLVRDVETALKADARTANLGVAVTSADGRVVVLQGMVPTRAKRTAVQDVATRVKGITRIDNRVVVP